jgi:hypothetical protein
MTSSSINGNNCSKILSWLIENKMNLDYKLDKILINELSEIYYIINNEKFGTNTFLKEDYSDFTLSKYLQLYSITNNNVYLAKWLIDNGIEKSSEYLNFIVSSSKNLVKVGHFKLNYFFFRIKLRRYMIV